MHAPSLLSVLAFCGALSSAAASSVSSYANRNSNRSASVPKRPSLQPHPHNAGKAMPFSPARSANRRCFVDAGTGNARDDASRILAAFKKCNNGGTVVLDGTYQVASPLDLTFLKHVDVVVTGTVTFKTDVYYWAEHAFQFPFQNMSSFWKFGGKDINIYGDLSNGASVLDGNGEAYWKELASNASLFRPMLFAFDGVEGATMSNLRMRNPPNWFNLIANSTDVLVSDMILKAASTQGNKVANSDGWDTYRSNRIVIQNSRIDNTDDCISFKPNSTNIVVQNLICNGSHGISVGSLGQYKGVTDIVENLYVYNISMSNASDGARIKVWPGVQTAFQATLNGGGGSGRVRNVTYDRFQHDNNDNAITITQCYGQKNQTLCDEYPANLYIEDVTMKNMWGTTSTKYDPRAGTLVCSAKDRCSNIVLQNIDVKVPSGEPPVYDCVNLDTSLLGVTCKDSSTKSRDTSQG